MDPFTIILTIYEILSAWSERKTRRRILAWLAGLNTAQKQLLRSCLSAAKASRWKSFERPIDMTVADEFILRCSLLLQTKAVTVEKYHPGGRRRYRFTPWLYDYLEGHPGLLESGEARADGEMARPAVTSR